MGTFWFAAFGGLAANYVRLEELAYLPRTKRTKAMKNPFFWFDFVGLPILGGFLAHAYSASGTVVSPILAVNIGVSAPLIFKKLAAALPPLGGRKTD